MYLALVKTSCHITIYHRFLITLLDCHSAFWQERVACDLGKIDVSEFFS